MENGVFDKALKTGSRIKKEGDGMLYVNNVTEML